MLSGPDCSAGGVQCGDFCRSLVWETKQESDAESSLSQLLGTDADGWGREVRESCLLCKAQPGCANSVLQTKCLGQLPAGVESEPHVSAAQGQQAGLWEQPGRKVGISRGQFGAGASHRYPESAFCQSQAV